MARLKKTSKVLEVARERLAGLKAITPAANFGANLTEPIYTAKIDFTAARLDRYTKYFPKPTRSSTLSKQKKPSSTTSTVAFSPPAKRPTVQTAASTKCSAAPAKANERNEQTKPNTLSRLCRRTVRKGSAFPSPARYSVRLRLNAGAQPPKH